MLENRRPVFSTFRSGHIAALPRYSSGLGLHRRYLTLRGTSFPFAEALAGPLLARSDAGLPGAGNRPGLVRCSPLHEPWRGLFIEVPGRLLFSDMLKISGLELAWT